MHEFTLSQIAIRHDMAEDAATWESAIKHTDPRYMSIPANIDVVSDFSSKYKLDE